MAISMGTDITEQLSLHDVEIKAAIAAHDASMTHLLDVHDTEIKAMLEQVLDDLDEIRRLLITPQGRRPGWNRRP